MKYTTKCSIRFDNLDSHAEDGCKRYIEKIKIYIYFYGGSLLAHIKLEGNVSLIKRSVYFCTYRLESWGWQKRLDYDYVSIFHFKNEYTKN